VTLEDGEPGDSEYYDRFYARFGEGLWEMGG